MAPPKKLLNSESIGSRTVRFTTDSVLMFTTAGIDFATTVSCYQADSQGRACGVCDACRLRSAGFAQAGVVDPTRYF